MEDELIFPPSLPSFLFTRLFFSSNHALTTPTNHGRSSATGHFFGSFLLRVLSRSFLLISLQALSCISSVFGGVIYDADAVGG
jgi:hypothetical protein